MYSDVGPRWFLLPPLPLLLLVLVGQVEEEQGGAGRHQERHVEPTVVEVELARGGGGVVAAATVCS